MEEPFSLQDQFRVTSGLRPLFQKVQDKTSAIYYGKIRVGNRGDTNSRFELHTFQVYKHKEVIGVDACTNEDFDKVVADYRTPTERKTEEKAVRRIETAARRSVEDKRAGKEPKPFEFYEKQIDEEEARIKPNDSDRNK